MQNICLTTCFMPLQDGVNAFWEEINEKLLAQGNTLVLLTTDDPERISVPAIRIPLLFGDYKKEYGIIPSNTVETFGEFELALIDRDRNWNGWHFHSVEDTVLGYFTAKSILTAVVHQLNPGLIWVWGSSLPQSLLLYRIAIEKGIPVQVIERGLLPGTYMLESRGNAGWSDLFVKPMSPSHAFDKQFFNRVKNYVLQQRQPKYVQNGKLPGDWAHFAASNGQKLIAFFGDFDLAAGTYPRFFRQSFATSPIFASTKQAFEVLKTLVENHPEWKLVFKPHPNDTTSYEGLESPKIRIVRDVAPYQLFKTADVLLFLGSTLQFEALFYEKPIVLLGRSQLWGQHLTYQVNQHSELPEVLNDAIQKKRFDQFRRKYPGYVCYLAREFLYFQTNTIGAPLTVKQLAKAINSGMVYLPDPRPATDRVTEFKQWLQAGRLHRIYDQEKQFIHRVTENFRVSLKAFNDEITKKPDKAIQASWERFYQDAVAELRPQDAVVSSSAASFSAHSALIKLASPVVIAGMHRSGTSLITHMLHTCGLHLGKESDLLPPAPDNPEGYWENIRFVLTNDTILKWLGGSWENPVEVELDRLKQAPDWPRLENHVQQLLKGFEGVDPWGWKDPRNSLTLSFWKHFLPQIKLVIPFRNPLDVAHSLQKRNGFPLEKGLSLWYVYNKKLLEQAGSEALWIPYERLLEEANTTFRTLLDWLGWEVDDQHIQQALGVIKPTLQHFRSGLNAVEQAKIPASVKELYAHLLEKSPITCQVKRSGIVQSVDEKMDSNLVNDLLLDIQKKIQNGQKEEARQQLQWLAETLAPDARCWNEVGVLFYQLQAYAQALEAFRKAYALDDSSIPVMKNLADLLVHLGETESAALLYARVFQLNALDEDALNFAGKLAFLTGQIDVARRIFQYVRKIHPENGVARQNLEFLHAAEAQENTPQPFSEPVVQFVKDVDAAIQLEMKETPAATEQSSAMQRCPSCASLATQRTRYAADIVTCIDCGLTYLRRLPSASQLKGLYDLYADEFSHMRLPRNPQEAKQSPLRRETFLEEVQSFVKRKGRVLDVGCGWGAFLDAAREKGFEPYGIEITPSAAEFANQQLNIPVDARPLEEQAFQPNSFSLVTMNHVLEHLPHTRQVLSKVFEILEPEGVFAGMVPNFASFCSEMEREHWAWLDPNFHYVHFTPETLRANLERAGFVVEKLYTTRGDYSPHRLKNCVYQKYGNVSDEEFRQIARELEESGRGEEIRFVARKPAQGLRPKKEPEIQSQARQEAMPQSASPVPIQQSGSVNHPQPFPKKTPLQVSIIIPVYNQVEYTRVCLERIYQHADPDLAFEVIVVDNASTDETEAFMKQIRKRYPNLTYIRSERNLKYAGGCNLGARKARGKYLVFLNNDTEPEPGWLRQAIRVFREEPNVGILGAKLLYPDRTIQHCGIEFQNAKIEHNFIWPFHRYRHAREDNPRVNCREEVHAVTGACLFIPRKLFQQVGGFDESYGMYFEDTDLCFKVRKKGKRVLYDPGIVVIHHEGKSTQNLDEIHQLNQQAAKKFYQKWEDELVEIALEVLLERVDGKYHYFSDFFYPRKYKDGGVTFLYKLFKRLGNFYAFAGGVGDALLFLSTFYDSVDEATVVCAPNNVATARILFNQFPKIKKVYFLPFPTAGVWHYTVRNLWYKLPNCKGVGVTPAESYETDWNHQLDIFRKYGVKAHPNWINMFRQQKITDFQVTLQPKGSVRGMVGSKRNIIRPRDWLKLQKYLIDNGITPVLLGAPEERNIYPALQGAIDRRSYNLIEQMQLIASSDVFIGADSWGKTMAGLAGIPAFVFRACRGKDLQNWTDPSEFVFMRPWKNMIIVDTFQELVQQFPQQVSRSMKESIDYSSYHLQQPDNLSPYFETLVKNNQVFLYRMAGLGDVLMAFPLARALKKKYPHLEVNFVTAYAYKHLVDANPYIDRFVPPEIYGDYLVFEPFAIDLNHGRYGYATQHQIDAFLEGLDLQLSDAEKAIELQVPSAAERVVEETFQNILQAYRRNGARSWNRVVLLHPARGDVNRTWPKERWEELARLLIGSGNLVIIVGNSSASPNRGIHSLRVKGAFHLEDQLSPLEFVALCRKADVLVSTDSGPIQLAGASDIAIVGIYSVVRGRNRLPYRNGQLGWKAVAVEPACPFKGCYEKMNDAAFMEPYLKMIQNGEITQSALFARWCVHQDKYACMRHQITVEQVWEALQPFLFSETDSARLLEEVETYLKIRRPDEALKLLERTVSRGNADARVLRKYIELLKQKGDLVNYIHHLERYVELNPEDASALNELGVARWQQERFDEAIALFEKAVSYNGNHPDHIKNLADAYLSQEEFQKAIPLYVYLIQKYPQDSEAYQRLAMLYIENGDYESARLLLDKALEYHPEDRYLQDWRRLLDTPRVYLAYQFINAGELDTARALLEEELTENPDQLAARLGLGSVLFQQKNYLAAKHIYQQTLTKYPDNAESLFYLAKIQLLQEDWPGFEALHQTHTEAFQTVPELRKLYIQALIEKGDFELALRELDQYLEAFPNDADGYIMLGNLFYEGGKSREALNFYHRALQLEPENEEVKKMVESLMEEEPPMA